LEPTLEGAMALARSATGPLSPHLPAFVTSLIDQRYAVVCVRAKAWRAAAFDAWLYSQGVDLADLQDVHVDEFIRRAYRPRRDCQAPPRRHEPFAVRQLLGYLRAQGLCAAAPVVIVPADVLVASFEQFLRHERGLATATIGYYRIITRDFLVHRFGSECTDLGALHASDIVGFVQHRARRLLPRGLKQIVTALRAFLRYAEYRGEIGASLIGAVPAVAAWTTTPPIPRAISAEHARLAIASCDQSTAVGRRDRAILLLLARLGLRAGEVITLLLEDIDWDAGRLCVRGKNGHQCLMPLPVDIGEAIAAYLQHGRPLSADRHLFLRSRAPLRGLLHGSDGIGGLVRNALQRAGVDAPHKGSHQFRHALAVRMLQDGASLPEIGELLRHRSPISTSIYAKVDLVALRTLALPWPGRKS
jgi:integrase/recombinase XerD